LIIDFPNWSATVEKHVPAEAGMEAGFFKESLSNTLTQTMAGSL
jgi:hypothetical protein